jgi:acetolactate decarboxylase
MPDSALVPFAFVTHFEADIVQDLGAVSSVDDLKKALEKLLPHKDAFYAVRLSGTFNKIQVRSVPKQTQPYPELKEAIKNQVVFDYQNIKGTLVGLWSPDYVGGINVPGPHLHFISEDLTLGGHLLDLDLASGQLSLDETRSLDLVLNPAGE